MVRVSSLGLIAMLLGACASSSPTSVDAAYDVVIPSDAHGDATLADAVQDVMPTVDVVAFDATMPHNEVGVQDASADSALSRCATIDDAYAAAVHDAQTCTSDSDCSVDVCETLCCNCRVYVNPTTHAYGVLSDLQREWEAFHCGAQNLCVPMPCDPPAGAQCGATGRCVTVRLSGGAG